MSTYSIPKKYVPGKGPRPTRPDSDLSKDAIEKERSVVNGVSLVVVLGDLTNEKCGCLVNAANSKLTHGAGLARAILKKGGRVIRMQSDEHLRKHGLIKTGELAVTDGGNLPCNNVLHVVGPMYEDGTKNEDQLLSLCMQNIIKACNDLKVSSVAVPAISSGLFKFPKDKVAKILYTVSITYALKKSDTDTLTEIRFTNFDSETVSYFEKFHQHALGGDADPKAVLSE
eukprot:TRINITY_DN3953_c4_g1_i1.p1 TRINITY_DN3953_c4_g1~~TRINITY_DN3953_c4_g1_i1.p1  ORF type:complete len:249 (+),score=36.96 TRINITY_DN3953_c4_g1_i1:64-747(+)